MLINDQLVVDLGGVHTVLSETVNYPNDIAGGVDLEVGSIVTYKVFFASRSVNNRLRLDIPDGE